MSTNFVPNNNNLRPLKYNYIRNYCSPPLPLSHTLTHSIAIIILTQDIVHLILAVTDFFFLRNLKIKQQNNRKNIERKWQFQVWHEFFFIKKNWWFYFLIYLLFIWLSLFACLFGFHVDNHQNSMQCDSTSHQWNSIFYFCWWNIKTHRLVRSKHVHKLQIKHTISKEKTHIVIKRQDNNKMRRDSFC